MCNIREVNPSTEHRQLAPSRLASSTLSTFFFKDGFGCWPICRRVGWSVGAKTQQKATVGMTITQCRNTQCRITPLFSPRRFRVPAYQSLVPPPAREAEVSAVHRGDGGALRREYLELWTFFFAQPNPLGKQSEMLINHHDSSSQETKSGSPQHRPSCL